MLGETRKLSLNNNNNSNSVQHNIYNNFNLPQFGQPILVGPQFVVGHNLGFSMTGQWTRLFFGLPPPN